MVMAACRASSAARRCSAIAKRERTISAKMRRFSPSMRMTIQVTTVSSAASHGDNPSPRSTSATTSGAAQATTTRLPASASALRQNADAAARPHGGERQRQFENVAVAHGSRPHQGERERHRRPENACREDFAPDGVERSRAPRVRGPLARRSADRAKPPASAAGRTMPVEKRGRSLRRRAQGRGRKNDDAVDVRAKSRERPVLLTQRGRLEVRLAGIAWGFRLHGAAPSGGKSKLAIRLTPRVGEDAPEGSASRAASTLARDAIRGVNPMLESSGFRNGSKPPAYGMDKS